MAIYTVFESVNMGSTHYAERIFDAVADVDIENGTFGYLDGLADGETHVYNFKAGTKAGAKVVVVDNPAWTEDASRTVHQRKDKYIIEAGTKFRVRVVKVNDEFAISREGFSHASQNYVTTGCNLGITDEGKLEIISETEGAAMVAVVERKRVVGGTLATAAHTYGYSKVMYEARITALA